MPLHHSSLVKYLALYCGTKKQSDRLRGVCFGYSSVYLSALLLQDRARLYERLALLNHYKRHKQKLFRDIHLARHKHKVNKENSLNHKEQLLLEIPAFFDSILIQQSPHRYSDPLNISGSQDYLKHLPLTQPCLMTSVPELIHESIYAFNFQELHTYLNELQDAIKQEEGPIGILINLLDHMVVISWNTRKNKWDLMDLNGATSQSYFELESHKPVQLRSDALAKHLFNLFYQREASFQFLNIQILGKTKHPILSAKLNAFNHAYFSQREVTNRTFRKPLHRTHPVLSFLKDFSLLKIAQYMGSETTLYHIFKQREATLQRLIHLTNSPNTPFLYKIYNYYLTDQTHHESLTESDIAYLEEIFIEAAGIASPDDLNGFFNTSSLSKKNAIHAAAIHGNIAVMKSLILAHGYAYEEDKDLLFIAIQYHQLDIVIFLLSLPKLKLADLHDDNFRTPLEVACLTQNLPIVRCLLNKDSRITSHPQDHDAIYYAIHSGSLIILETVLTQGTEIDEKVIINAYIESLLMKRLDMLKTVDKRFNRSIEVLKKEPLFNYGLKTSDDDIKTYFEQKKRRETSVGEKTLYLASQLPPANAGETVPIPDSVIFMPSSSKTENADEYPDLNQTRRRLV